MDKNIIKVFNEAVATGKKLFEAIAEVEEKFNISVCEADAMALTVQSEPFAKQMSYLDFTDGGNTSLKEGGHSILEPTLCICSEKLLAEIAESLVDTAEAQLEQKQKSRAAFKKYADTSNTSCLLGSIIARGRILKYDYKEAADTFAKVLIDFCENDLLLAAVILNTKGDVICWNVLKGYTKKPNNKLFGGHDSMYCTAIRTVREHLQVVYTAVTTEQTQAITTVAEPVIKEEIIMTKKELIKIATKLGGKEVAAATRKHVSISVEDGAQFLYNVLVESGIEVPSELAQFVGAEAEVAEETSATSVQEVEQLCEVPTTTAFELIGEARTVKTVNIEVLKSAHALSKTIQKAMNSTIMLALPELSSASKTVEIDAKLARQIRQARDEQAGISAVRRELEVLEQQLVDEIAEYIAELNTGRVKAGCGNGGFASRSHLMFSRLGSFISEAQERVDFHYMKKANEATKESRAKVAKLIEENQTKRKATTIKVAQIPSRKERAKQVVTPVAETPIQVTPVPTQTVAPVQTTPVEPTVVKTVPVQTTASKGVPTPKNPKGGNGAKRDVRIQVRATGDKYVGYVAVAKLSTKVGDKVISKTIKAEGDHIANALWNVLADALTSVDKNKVGKVFIDVPDIFVKAISTHKNGFKKFKWAREEALRFADVRDEFNTTQLVFRTNGGCGFKTDAAFVSPSTRKEVGVAPTVRE